MRWRNLLWSFLLATISTLNLCVIPCVVIGPEKGYYVTVRDSMLLSDFTQFDLVQSNSHLASSISSSEIAFSRKDADYDDYNQRIKYIYSLLENFSCYDFEFSFHIDLQFVDLHEVGLFEVQFSSRYDPYNVGTCNSDTIGSMLIVGRPYRSSVGFELTRYYSNEDTGYGFTEYAMDIPISIDCWGSRLGNKTILAMYRNDTGTRIIKETYTHSNSNDLQYISIGYSSFNYNDYYNITISDLNIIFYSTVWQRVLDTNASLYTNFSQLAGLIFPVAIGLSFTIGISVLVIRKRENE